MNINGERLKSRMDQINTIAVTEEKGMMRLALSDADKTARDLLGAWMRESGMEVQVDDMGTMYGILKGKNPTSLPICIGSHMDTQPNGGKYDGFFGVMAGLEAVCSIREQGIVTESDLVVINWTNEEGARFVPPMLASGVAAGIFQGSWVYDLKDTEGIRYEDELIRIGYKGSRENRLEKAKFYFEPHIEQGPVLDAEGYSLGIVTGALGITGLDVKIYGDANHAGTTPMSHRKDALMIAAEVLLKLREKCIAWGEPAVITNGVISALPASKNIVPGEVYFSIDMRDDDGEGLNNLEEEIRRTIWQICEKYDAAVVIDRYWKAEPTHFHPLVIEAVAEAAKEMNVKARTIISGAGHDAVFINNMIPTGMLFVPSIDGRSHCPQEETKWEDLLIGTQATMQVLLKLDMVE